MRPLPRDPSPSHREASARAPNARAHKRFVPRTTDGLRFRAFKPDPALVGCMSGSEISAPASTFLSGLGKTLGYNVEADGERLAIAFEPWSLEHEDPFEVPCLRLQFRQDGDRIILERLLIADAAARPSRRPSRP